MPEPFKPLEPSIVVEETTNKDDRTGRDYITFRAVFKPDVTASGSLSFAIYTRWTDEPATHVPARKAVIANARNVMRIFADKLNAAAVQSSCPTAARLTRSPNTNPLNKSAEKMGMGGGQRL